MNTTLEARVAALVELKDKTTAVAGLVALGSDAVPVMATKIESLYSTLLAFGAAGEAQWVMCGDAQRAETLSDALIEISDATALEVARMRATPDVERMLAKKHETMQVWAIPLLMQLWNRYKSETALDALILCGTLDLSDRNLANGSQSLNALNAILNEVHPKENEFVDLMIGDRPKCTLPVSKRHEILDFGIKKLLALFGDGRTVDITGVVELRYATVMEGYAKSDPKIFIEEIGMRSDGLDRVFESELDRFVGNSNAKAIQVITAIGRQLEIAEGKNREKCIALLRNLLAKFPISEYDGVGELLRCRDAYFVGAIAEKLMAEFESNTLFRQGAQHIIAYVFEAGENSKILQEKMRAVKQEWLLRLGGKIIENELPARTLPLKEEILFRDYLSVACNFTIVGQMRELVGKQLTGQDLEEATRALEEREYSLVKNAADDGYGRRADSQIQPRRLFSVEGADLTRLRRLLERYVRDETGKGKPPKTEEKLWRAAELLYQFAAPALGSKERPMDEHPEHLVRFRPPEKPDHGLFRATRMRRVAT